jgi:hypothetical protein
MQQADLLVVGWELLQVFGGHGFPFGLVGEFECASW